MPANITKAIVTPSVTSAMVPISNAIYIQKLQEYIQKLKVKKLPKYEIEQVEGSPDHSPLFYGTLEIHLPDKSQTGGFAVHRFPKKQQFTCSTKKEVQQKLAQEAFEFIQQIIDDASKAKNAAKEEKVVLDFVDTESLPAVHTKPREYQIELYKQVY
jgi:hypothetical protein